MSTHKHRRRLPPEERRAAILDVAADIVAREGVSAASVDRLSAEVGVSKALIYSYFSNRNTLLGELLLREYPAFKETETLPVDAQSSFEDVVRRTTHDYLDHVAEKGILLQRLLAEPGIVATITTKHQMGREVTARYFAELMVAGHDLPIARATVVADILMGVTRAAGNLLFRSDIDRHQLAELVVRIILTAARSADSDYATHARRSINV